MTKNENNLKMCDANGVVFIWVINSVTSHEQTHLIFTYHQTSFPNAHLEAFNLFYLKGKQFLRKYLIHCVVFFIIWNENIPLLL